MKSKLNCCFSFHPLSFGYLCVFFSPHATRASSHLVSIAQHSTAQHSTSLIRPYSRFVLQRSGKHRVVGRVLTLVWLTMDGLETILIRKHFSVTSQLLCANSILHRFSMHCSVYCVASLGSHTALYFRYFASNRLDMVNFPLVHFGSVSLVRCYFKWSFSTFSQETVRHKQLKSNVY